MPSVRSALSLKSFSRALPTGGWRRPGRWLIALLALLVASPASAYYIIGDSIGVGVGWAAPHSDSLAANSVRISSNVIFNQISQVPRGSLVFLSLGTNDAVGNVTNVESWVQRIVDAAVERNLTLVWIGPPCVFKDWDAAARQLDRNLAAQLGALGVTYVSMRDPSLCDRAVRGSDGVHFTMTGYERMWSIAATAAGFDPGTGAPDIPVPLPVPNQVRIAGGGVDATTTAAVTPAPAEAAAYVQPEAQPDDVVTALLTLMAAAEPTPDTAAATTPAADIPIPMPRPPFVEQHSPRPPIPIANPFRQNVAIGY